MTDRLRVHNAPHLHLLYRLSGSHLRPLLLFSWLPLHPFFRNIFPCLTTPLRLKGCYRETISPYDAAELFVAPDLLRRRLRAAATLALHFKSWLTPSEPDKNCHILRSLLAAYRPAHTLHLSSCWPPGAIEIRAALN